MFNLIIKQCYFIYFLKCRKNTESKNPNVRKRKNRRMMLLSSCVICNSKKPKFIKEQEASGSF